MQIRLIHKFAQAIDGIDLSPYRAGEVIDLSARDAGLLIAEGWASATSDPAPATARASNDDQFSAGDEPS